MHEVMANAFSERGEKVMNELVNLIVGSSTSLDVYVMVRLIIMMVALELFATACGFLGGYEVNVIFDFHWYITAFVAVRHM